MPNTEIRTEFLLMKTRATPEFQNNPWLQGTTQRFHFLRDTIIGQGPQMPLGAKPSDGVFWLTSKTWKPIFRIWDSI
jgi:hypothetical protein